MKIEPIVRTFMTRSPLEEVRIGKDFLYSVWKADDEIEVETWLIARTPWHIRAHKITTNRALFATEGGFGIQRTDTPPTTEIYATGHSEFVTETATQAQLEKMVSDSERVLGMKYETHIPTLF